VKDACKRSRNRAQARNEFASRSERAPCFEKRPSVRRTQESGSREILQRSWRTFDAFAAAKLIPDGVRGNRGEDYIEQRGKKTHAAGTGERAGGEQEGHGRKRQSQLLGEHPSKQQYISVMEEEFERAVHGWRGRGSPVIYLRKEQYAPH